MADYKCPICPEWETSSAGMNKHFADTHTGRTTPAADALPSLGTPTEIVEEMRGNQPPAATESIPTTDLVSVDQGKDTSSP